MPGGSGFVGKALANRLARDGVHVVIPTRQREQHREDLILLPNVDLVQANVHEPAQLAEVMQHCDAVINLVGILNEKRRDGSGFQFAHVELVEKLIEQCHALGIKRFLQMSALNADAEAGTSFYQRSKGRAEDSLHADRKLAVTSYQPSVIFGPRDSFFNRFAALLKITPVFFPLACHSARFAPVYVGDVVDLIARTLADPHSVGRRFQLCGPRDYTLKQLVEYTAACLQINRVVIPLNDTLSRLQAHVFDFIPGKPFSTDNYLSAQTDSVCNDCDWSQFNIQPTAIETIVPEYLQRRNFRSHYDDYRKKTG